MSSTAHPLTAQHNALDNYNVHSAANMFPLIDPDNLTALAEDIKAHGQQEPIWMFQGQLLDGRNRVLACAIAGVTPTTQEWQPKPGETPSQFVMSRNLHRRHLTASQRAALAVELEAVIAEENRIEKARTARTAAFSHTPEPHQSPPSPRGTSTQFTRGDPTGPARVGSRVRTGRTRDKAADAMKVSAGYVNDAKDLRKSDPGRFEQVKAGELTLAKAQDEVVAEAQQRGDLDKVGLRPGVIRESVRRLEAAAAAEPIRLPKATKVVSSATTLQLTVTFGNQDVAETYLNQLRRDRKVLDLDYTVLEKRPRRRHK